MFSGSLPAVTLPDSLELICAGAFNGAVGLRDVYYTGSEAQWNQISIASNNNENLLDNPNLTIHYNVADWGYCGGEGDGTNVTWVLDNDGTLTINGSGAMADFYYDTVLSQSTSPWYAYRRSINKLIVEEGIKNIGDSTAYDSVITELSLPDTLTKIGKDAFFGCQFESIQIPETVTSIGDWAFAHTALESVTIPGGVTDIAPFTFSDCEALRSVTIQDGVVNIGDSAFACGSLQHVSLPASIRVIDDYAFSGCWTEIAIPNGVTTIGTHALCSGNMERIFIPASVTTIKPAAFSAAPSLISITVDTNNPVYHADGNCLIESATNTLIRGCKASVIPTDGSVTNIGESAFYSCFDLEQISLPNTITEIGTNAFYNCQDLKDLVIPNQVTYIGTRAFEYCSGLTSIMIPNRLTSIENEVFCHCNNLPEVTIPNSVQRIGSNAFSYCEKLTDIVIPNSVTFIGADAFSSCSRLTSIIIPNGVTSIKSYTFYRCYNLSEVTIPDSVTEIEYGAFNEDEALRDVYYTGSEVQWVQIEINNYIENNAPLLNANLHFNVHDHTPGETVIENNVPATCTEAGGYDEVIRCTQCQYEFSRTHVTVDPINHRNAYEVAATEATEAAHGHTAGLYCPDCDTWRSGEVVHNALGAQTVIKPATEEEEGLVDIVCTVCGETFRYTAEKLPHTDPQPSGTGDTGNGFWMRIQSFFKGIIDWFLRLFKFFG